MLAGSYMAGAYLGLFLGGALIGGLIPFIICLFKKRLSMGFAALLLCGLAAFIHSMASIVLGVVFIVAAIRAK